MFSYTDSTAWALYVVSFVTALAAGAAMPSMTLVFGGFVTTITDFATGVGAPDHFRSEVNRLA